MTGQQPDGFNPTEARHGEARRRPHRLRALSLAPAAQAWLERTRSARVLHVFERACNLASPDGEILALVGQEVGAGPFSVVVEADSALPGGRLDFSEWVDADAMVTVGSGKLNAGPLAVDTRQAMLWNPRPEWERLRGRPDALKAHLPTLRGLLVSHAPAESLAALIANRDAQSDSGEGLDVGRELRCLDVSTPPRLHRPTPTPALPLKGGGSTPLSKRLSLLSAPADRLLLQRRFVEAARRPAAALCGGIAAGDVEACREAAGALAGLGGGLTPAGDDFLLGALYALWATRPSAQAAALAEAIAGSAIPRTARLSAAWLKAAARGEAGQPWHTLVGALAADDSRVLDRAVHGILSVGHTSGADALAGFVLALGQS